MGQRLGIEHPVLRHAVLVVLGKLDAHVAVRGSRAKRLDHQIGRAFDMFVADPILVLRMKERQG